MKQKGFFIAGVLVLSSILLSFLGIWYREVIIQNQLSYKLLEEKALLIEARELTRLLQEKTSALTEEEKALADPDFLLIKEEGVSRWEISREPGKEKNSYFKFNMLLSKETRIKIRAKNL